MLHDANAAIPKLDGGYDCCVVGAGPAGVALALRMAEGGRRVLLLEAGGREFSAESQSIYEGELLGHDYDPLEAPRLRYLGGTTGHWGGQCILLDRSDFESRRDVPLSGWPIGYDDLEPYQKDAARFLKVQSFGEARRGVDNIDAVQAVTQRWSSDRSFYEIRNNDPLRVGDAYYAALNEAPEIDLILNANLTRLSADPTNGRITGARFENYEGAAGEVSADFFVLAMGGIENSRFLLHLNAENENRFGNQGDMVGRCFMEHPVLHNGAYFITRRLYSHSRYWEFERLLRRQKPELVLSPSPQTMLDEGMLNCAVHLDRLNRRPLNDRDLGETDFIRRLEFDEDYFFVGNSWTVCEQAPHPGSRVLLVDQRDRFGLRKVGLDWRVSPIVAETMRFATMKVAEWLIRTGLGRMQMNPELIERHPDPAYDYSRHHMGGARMSDTPETGVVDADCRVHGSGNLYVAGSAVFSTSGHANPTFSIVQMALRLGDHLISRSSGAR